MRSRFHNRMTWGIVLGVLVLALALAPMAFAQVWTDQQDYSPGSVVTIHGDNSDGAGYLPGEIVHVDVQTPDGTPKGCDATVSNDTAANGAWSCMITLNPDSSAIGEYSYTATGLTSGVSEIGTFTDGNASSISGTVTDSFNNPISGVTISCTSGCNASISTTTDASGNYSFSGGNKLSFAGDGPATITLIASKTGYTSATQTLSNVYNKDIFTNVNFALTLACTAPSITTQPAGATKTVGDPVTFSVTASGTAPLSYQWYKGTVQVGNNSDSYSISSVLTSDAGNYKVVVSNLCNGSSNATSNTAVLVVNKANTTTTVTVNDATYDGNTHGGNATVTGAGGLNTSLTLTFAGRHGTTYGPSTTAPTNAGYYTASASFAGDDNYNSSSGSKDFAITKQAASVTPDAASKAYGDPDPTLTGTLSGFVAADGVTATYSRTAGETIAGSPYVISATLSPAGVLGNYDITYNTANFTISKRTASVTPDAANKTYGDADPALTGTLSGFLAGDNVTATYSRTTGETVAGSPYTISATLSPAGVLSNYQITYNTAAFTIAPKAASVAPNAASKTYGDPDPELTGTLTGFLTADNVTATYSRVAGETVAGGPYIISSVLSPSGVLINYNITYNTANFTITPKAASVTPNTASKTYGDPDPALTGTLSDFLAGDSVTATYNRTAGETVTGSPYTISATLSPADVLGNYNITYNTASFTIYKRAASVTPAAASKIYGDADPTLAGTLNGFVATDNVTAAYSRTAGETVGTYTISASLSPAGVLGNYDITYKTADFTIDKRAASVTPTAASKTYGDPDPTLTGTLSNFIAADDVTATYSRTAGETVAGSPYTISATLSPAGALGNYDITYNTAAFTISKRAASVTPVAASKIYGDADPTLTGTLSNFVAADGVTAAYSRTAGETVAGSPYTISATLSPAGVLGNYDITYNNATFTINSKAVSVTPNAASKTYGDLDPSFTGTVSGFLTADSVTATYSRTAGETVLGGPYTISATLSPVEVLSNYDITYKTATFTITPKSASVTPNDASKIFGSADPILTGTLNGFLAADNVTAIYSRTPGETVAGSPYTISAVLSPAGVLANYNITYNTAQFAILSWTLSGFYQPVDMSTQTTLVYNTAKNGSTIPLKFEIFAGTTELTNTNFVKGFTYAPTKCDAASTSADVETLATGGTSLRYDMTASQFIYNWKTPNTAGCYRVTMTTQDLSTIVAYFKLK